MAGLLSRAATVIKAKFSRLLTRAEDPGEQLDYSYEQQVRLLQDVKRGVADVVTAKKRLQLQTSKLEQDLVKLEEQARQALAAGREDLARQALERIGEAATGIGRQMESTGLAIQRARDKTDEMQARAAAVDELIAAGTLEDFTTGETQLDRELAQLSSSQEVDAELARLKGELGPGAEEQKQLEQ